MDTPSQHPTVLVTGSTRGIGLATVQDLVAHGWQVFAGTRRDGPLPGPLADPESRGEVVAVRLDLTAPDDHRRAADQVGEAVGASGLDALVNNAGAALVSPLEHVPLDELRQQLEVNLVGQLGITQAVLPLLRTARGRIVNISSIGGLVAGPILGPYHVSKFGLEAMSDTLRRELRHLGVSVTVIEPGTVRTDIWDTSRERGEALAARLPDDARTTYGHLVERARAMADEASGSGVAPAVVATAIRKALTADRPPARVLVGTDARIARVASRLLPTRVLDRFLAPDPPGE